jgi:hypothetical protein
MTDTTPVRTGMSLGVAAIILGTLALLVSWIPFVGAFGLPLSGIGLVLAVIGLVIALRGGRGLGYHIAGIAICGLAILMATCSTLVGTKTVEGVNEALRKSRATNQTSATGSSQTPTPTSSASTETGTQQWADGTQPVRQGDIEVQVLSAHVGKAAVIDIGGDRTKSKEDFLIINLKITNRSATKKIEYRSWQGQDVSFERDYANVTDDAGNTYRRSSFGFGTRLNGNVVATSIYPGKSVEDTLAVEPPVALAKQIRIELPAKNFGGEGMLRIQIPSAFIKS